MALENYIEMRDLVDDPDFLLQQALERALEARHPGRFVPHYSMVTFMRIPYSLALERSNVQRGILTEATRGLDSLDGVDWTAVDAEVERQLEPLVDRSEEHTSELQSLMRISYAVFCLKKKKDARNKQSHM